jgi:hypothetical protein
VTRSRSVEACSHFGEAGVGLVIETAVAAGGAKATLKGDERRRFRFRPCAITDCQQILEREAAVDFAP